MAASAPAAECGGIDRAFRQVVEREPFLEVGRVDANERRVEA